MRRLIIVLSLALVAVACGEDSPSSDHSAGGHGDNSPVADDAREIPVTASSLRFDPSEIRIRAGEDVAIRLTADDLEHDLTIDQLGTHVVAAAGKAAVGGVDAPDPGEYVFYCSVPGHREAGMLGTLVVS